MKKILIISHSAELNGAQRVLLTLIKNINRKKFEVVVVCPSSGLLVRKLREVHVRVYCLPYTRDIFIRKNVVYNFFRCALCIGSKILIIPALLWICFSEKPDIVYTNTALSFAGAFVSSILRKPHIWHVHELFDDACYISYLPKPLIRDMMNKSSHKIIAVSNAVASQLSDCSNKVNVVYNALEADNAGNTENSSTDFGLKENDWPVCVIGVISKLKLQSTAVESLKYVNNRIPGIKLLLIGEGSKEMKAYLQNLAVEHSVQDKVIFTGRIDNTNQVINRCAAVLIPSPLEGFSLVAYEALNCAKPVIAADRGGVIEVVENNETGFLVEPNNPVKIAEKLIYLYQNPEVGKRIGENGKSAMLRKFPLDSFIKKIECILEEAHDSA